MTFKVYVDGQEGTTGLRIDALLSGRADLELLKIDAARRKDPAARAELLNAADVAFLCLPDAAAREAAALLENPATCLLDASSAHRTDPGWVFGLPELEPGQRQKLRSSKRIAVPGCHASAFILGLRPLTDAGLVPPGEVLHAYSLTGYSGGGKAMIAQYQTDPRPATLESPRPYALGLNHKHLPEIQHHARLEHPPVFTPVVGPFYKGLAVTTFLEPERLGTTRAALHAALEARYADEAFVQVHPQDREDSLDGGFFNVQGANDTNRVDLFVFGNDARAVLIARLDNLGKGASGAAVQAMNVHLGLEEGLGL